MEKAKAIAYTRIEYAADGSATEYVDEVAFILPAGASLDELLQALVDVEESK